MNRRRFLKSILLAAPVVALVACEKPEPKKKSDYIGWRKDPRKNPIFAGEVGRYDGFRFIENASNADGQEPAVLTKEAIQKAVDAMEASNIPPYQGDNYAAILWSRDLYRDVKAESAFVEISNYQT